MTAKMASRPDLIHQAVSACKRWAATGKKPTLLVYWCQHDAYRVNLAMAIEEMEGVAYIRDVRCPTTKAAVELATQP